MPASAIRSVNRMEVYWDPLSSWRTTSLTYEVAIRPVDLQGAAVIGPSFGGTLAAELVANFSDRFSRMILLAPAGVGSESTSWGLDSCPSRSAFRDCSSSTLTPVRRWTSSQRRACSVRWMRRREHLDVGMPGEVVVAGARLRPPEVLHRVSSPMLVSWGEDEDVIPVEYAQEFARLIPRSRVEIILAAGTCLHVEQFEAASALIKVFVTSCFRGGCYRRQSTERGRRV